MTPRIALPVLALSIALLAACGDRDTRSAGARPDGAADPLLPTPQGAGSSVTGMPGAGTPGPQPGEQVAVEPEVPLDENGNPILPDAVAGEDAVLDPANPETGTPAGEPGPADAVNVIRDYYGAINAGAFANAYQLWANGGRASNQSPEAFAEGFAQTRGVSVEIGEPSNGDAAAGSRFAEVPVTITATQRDDTVRRYTGLYTLRRVAPGIEGATPEQLQWRIASAALQEVP